VSSNNTAAFHWPVRVYYEDTDFGGVVYYANYLKFIERARTEWVREIGIDQARLKAEEGIVFAVRRLEANYLAPARFDDVLTVETEIIDISGARITLSQAVRREGETLFDSTVLLVALSESGRPVRLPADVRRRMD